LAGGREDVDVELEDAEVFLELFCAATPRAGGAEDRRPADAPAFGLVALT
jgi:hypothetical protein